MRFKAVLPVALLMGIAAAHAQDAVSAPVTNETLSGAPITMKLNLTPGQVRGYKISINQDSTMTMPGAGQGMPMKMDLTAIAKLFVDKKNPDNSYVVRYRIGGFKGTMNVNGQSMALPGMPESMEIGGVLNPDGSFKANAKSRNAAPMGGMGMDTNQMMSGMLTNLMSIPEKPVAVGDTWLTTIAMPLDPTEASTISVTNKVLSVDTENGQEIARLAHDYSGPLNLTMTQPAAMTMTGTINGTGASRVSVKSGQTLSSSSTVKMIADIAVANGAGNGESMNMKMDSTVISRVESMILPATPAKKPAVKKPAAKKPAAKKPVAKKK